MSAPRKLPEAVERVIAASPIFATLDCSVDVGELRAVKDAVRALLEDVAIIAASNERIAAVDALKAAADAFAEGAKDGGVIRLRAATAVLDGIVDALRARARQ